MSGNKVIKPVSFNKTREDEREMLKHLQKRNFSGYVKKLILADMKAKEEKKRAVKAEGQSIKLVEKTLTAAEKLKLMNEKLKAGPSGPTEN